MSNASVYVVGVAPRVGNVFTPSQPEDGRLFLLTALIALGGDVSLPAASTMVQLFESTASNPTGRGFWSKSSQKARLAGWVAHQEEGASLAASVGGMPVSAGE